jgi:hypothetical protein
MAEPVPGLDRRLAHPLDLLAARNHRRRRELIGIPSPERQPDPADQGVQLATGLLALGRRGGAGA